MRDFVDGYNGFYLHVLLITHIFIMAKTENIFTAVFSQGLPQSFSDCSFMDTQLDLSKKKILSLQTSDFICYTKLTFLNISYNLIEVLDCSVFKYNSALERLDISNNRLHTIQCNSLHFIKNISFLDLSTNNFETMNLCREFTTMTQLKYIGLGARQIQKDSFLNIAPIHLEYVFLETRYLMAYENGSLQLLNTNKLQISLPSNQENFRLLCDALDTSRIVEISGFLCNETCDYVTRSFSKMARQSKVSTLILGNFTMSGNEIINILQSVLNSSVEHLYINKLTLKPKFTYTKLDYSHHSLNSFTVEHLIYEVFYFDPPHPLNIFAEMMIENATFSDVEIIHFFCPPKPSIFRFLNLANNRITDEIFLNCENVAALELLNLQNNKLEQLSKISAMTFTMPNLNQLDLSKNQLKYDKMKQCKWSASLIFLNLSTNKLTDFVFSCLPINLQILDLSQNEITSVPMEVNNFQNLKELNLALNHLPDIPDCHSLSNNLKILIVDGNFIHSPSKTFLHNCQYVERVSAGNNPFECNCDLREFVKVNEQFSGKLDGWPEAYQCQYPENLRGVFLKDIHLSEISCNLSMLLGVVLGSAFVLMIFIILACIYFDLPWYIGMMCQWIRTKHRLRNVNLQDIQKDKRFHAFISYSQEDSTWVRNILLPNLERKDGSLKICYHERHFMPGKAIIENIIDCIEQSYKSIFILSPNFIQSEWCHYELYFAQHTLFGKSSDNLILILLDPIPPYLIPNKYNKLKAIMKQRTYLEWPKEKGKQGLFWANLRETIHINLEADPEDDHGTFLNNTSVEVCNIEDEQLGITSNPTP